MSTDRTFSDEDLTAYLDGQLDTASTLALDLRLANDAELANRLAALDIPLDDIRAAFESQLSQAPVMPNLPVQMAPPAANLSRAPSWTGFTMGGLSGLAAGLAIAVFTGLGQKAVEPQPRGWLDVVANYQMLYVPEVVNTNASQNAGPGGRKYGYATLADMSALIKTDLAVFKNIEGIKYKRAQQFAFNGQPLIQLAYTLPDGTPISICILLSEKEPSAVRSQTLEGLAANDWTTGTHGVVIIGGQNQKAIDRLTPAIQSLI